MNSFAFVGWGGLMEFSWLTITNISYHDAKRLHHRHKMCPNFSCTPLFAITITYSISDNLKNIITSTINDRIMFSIILTTVTMSADIFIDF